MYKIKLPDNEHFKEYELENNLLVIIGANGSGKSRLGAWLEQQNEEEIHRVSAQRALNFKEYIDIKSYKQSEALLFRGSEDLSAGKAPRWNWGKYTTTLVDDYNAVLSSLIAKHSLQNEKFINQCKEYDKENKPYEKVPETVVDQLYKIWNEIYPHRKIKISDAQIIAQFKDKEYKGIEMSDGERVALYLIAQCLVIPKGKTIIIDEPEVHLHRSIMNKLWREIESIRKDCIFIYITHDTQFAASHSHAKKLWVKEYDGVTWEYEFVKEDNALPEECLLDILGNRKRTIFVEGTEESYDTSIYREIYKDSYVVPCGSSLNVIAYTKAMKSNEQLHHLEAYGIIDRDYKVESEIEHLRQNNIFTLDIAEVENLFCVEEVLIAISDHLSYGPEKVEEIKQYVIEERFKSQLETQKVNAISTQLKYKISTYDISGKSVEILEDKVDALAAYINFKEIREKVDEEFKEILLKNDYKEVLKIFNEKSLAHSIGRFFDMNNKKYCDTILRMIKKGNSSIIKGMSEYLPEI